MYEAIGITKRRPGYNYFFNGNLNISLYGWTVPLNYTFSNQQSQFQQPFNQFGATPYYKWIKFYIGYSAMQFSTYSLNNHIFLGGGVQLTPGIFRFSAMGGRFQRAVEEDTANKAIVPFYERLGGGFKIGVGKESDYADLIFFTAKDNPNSIQKTILDWEVKPAQNTVISGVFSKRLFKNLIVSGEYASSVFTKDVRLTTEKPIPQPVFNAIPGFIANSSTSFHKAFKIMAAYTTQTYNIGLTYENIDPGYRSMGTYFFNDDLESISANGSTRILKNKLNISGAFGLQRNNSKSEKIANTERTVWMINIQYNPNARLNINAGFSDFQTFTRVQSQFQRINQLTPFDNLDTLNFTQIASSLNAGASYVLSNPSKKTKKDMIQTNTTYQIAGNKNTTYSQNAPETTFINNNTSFTHSHTPSALSFSIGFNTNITEFSNIKTALIGPIASCTKSFFQKKLKLTVSTAWTNSLQNGSRLNEIFNFRISSGYTIKKHHTFTISSTVIRKNVFTTEFKSPSFTEFTINSGYTFNF